jgi:hypothetical protein
MSFYVFKEKENKKEKRGTTMGNAWEFILNKAYPEISDLILREMLYKDQIYMFTLPKWGQFISKESQTGMLISKVNLHFLKWVTHDVASLL